MKSKRYQKLPKDTKNLPSEKFEKVKRWENEMMALYWSSFQFYTDMAILKESKRIYGGR